VLSEHPKARIRVLVVWEPILATDLGPPLPWVLSGISDHRAMQFWDSRRALSAELNHGAVADPSGSLAAFTDEIGSTFWDVIALFPPGVRWDSPPPNPSDWHYPVVAHLEEVRKHLSALNHTTGSPGARHQHEESP
jgi:hypothetical protein